MLNILMACLVSLFTPTIQVLNVAQVNKVLNTSVLIRSKVYEVNPEKNKIRWGMIGCSGTYIGPNTVLTAAHCFTHPEVGIWVRGVDKTSYEAKLVKIDPSRDLALLGVLLPKPHVFSTRAKKVREGEAVTNVGSPYVFEFLLSEGTVAGLKWSDKPFTGHYIVTTAMINSGSSGGGAFNESGELIGVNTMTYGGFGGWAGISMAVDVATIEEFLKGVK
jgi:S1-C subfamily serine protease